ncbi:MAG: nitrilase-related carbon-nitrogen hydrolase, partial [Pseudolabrys sp.]
QPPAKVAVSTSFGFSAIFSLPARAAAKNPATSNKAKIAVFICYEDIIPSFVNSIVAAGDPDLLVNMTNDAWFGDSTEPWIHLALAELRAVEHRRFLVRSTNSGVSAIVDPVGRVIAHTGTFRPEAIAAEVAWLRPTTVYGVIGNGPWWVLSAAAIALAFIRKRPLAARFARTR